jgi:uncharacterized protein (TIGR02145 family)
MKTTRFFLLICSCIVSFILLFVSCGPNEIIPPVEEKEEPYVTISYGKVTKTSATLYAQVFPYNNEVTIKFQYAISNSQEWTTYTFEEKVSGSDYVLKSYEIVSLKPGTSYKFRALANDIATEEKAFNTIPIDKAKIIVYPPDKVTKTTALVKAAVVAGLEDTATVTFKYSIKGENKWQTFILSQKYFGTDTVKLQFDLFGLKSNTRYQVLFEIANDGGVSTAEDSIFTYAVNDYDGNLYHTVTIGEQTWLRENFMGTHFANGDAIPNVTDANEWANLSTPAYCWYNNDPEIGKVYGGLYNWWVATDSRELITDFKTPSGPEFVKLGNYLADGITYKAAQALMEAGTAHWRDGNGTNTSDFTGLPNGGFYPRQSDEKWVFGEIGESLNLWQYDIDFLMPVLTEIYYSRGTTFVFGPGHVYRDYSLGVGIRLLKK